MAVVRLPGSGTLAVLLLLASAQAVDTREAPRASEYQVKAAFLYNFAKFVHWPDERTLGPAFTVAVLGEDPFGGILESTFAGKTILDRNVEVRRISAPEAAGKFQILFIGSSERPRLAEILKALEGTSVLTVGEMDGFSDRGGMITFKLKNDLVRFDINLDQVERAHLKMSSQLIRLALRVISKGDGV
ncbi:MAG TPA: YfiR family protein [Vicinamibacteria bacterium]|nr:YfiR family protein [Vicinamibacteria bacterium]